MAAKRKLTWDKAGERWQKISQGKIFHGQRGVPKSDHAAYRKP